MARARDLHTRDLFATPEPVAVGFAAEIVGHGALSSQITRVVSRTLQDARDDLGLSREAIAAAMTKTLGRKITEDALDKWASEAADDRRMPIDAYVALIGATQGFDALGFIPSLFGFAVVEDRYVDVIQLAQLEEHERTIAARKAMLSARMRGRR